MTDTPYPDDPPERDDVIVEKVPLRVESSPWLHDVTAGALVDEDDEPEMGGEG